MLVVGARRVLGVTIPPLKHFGPLLVVWGAAMLMLVFIRDLGSSLMFFGAFLALLYVATGRLSFVVAGPGAVRRRAPGSSPARSGTCRSASTSGSTRGRTRATPASRSPSRCSRRPTAGCSGRGFGAGAARAAGRRADPAGARHRPDLRRDHERGRPVRRGRGRAHLPAVRRARLPGRDACRGRLLEAARDGPHGGVRAAGVRDRRRRHAGDPADRA